MLSWNSALNSWPLQPTQREEEGGCEWLTVRCTCVFRNRVSGLPWAHMYFVCCECFKGLCIFPLRKASVLKLAIVLGKHFGYLSNSILHRLSSQPGLNLAGCKLRPWRVCTCVPVCERTCMCTRVRIFQVLWDSWQYVSYGVESGGHF